MRADKVRPVADQAALRDQRALRITTVCLGIFAVMLGVVFEKQNVAFMVMLAFAVACSANFPVLFMSVLWKDCTTRGAVWGGTFGLISSLAMKGMSPAVWEASFGNPKGSALYPYASSAVFSMTGAFLVIWIVSLLDKSAEAAKERALFPAQLVRSETGVGSASASGHQAGRQATRQQGNKLEASPRTWGCLFSSAVATRQVLRERRGGHRLDVTGNPTNLI